MKSVATVALFFLALSLQGAEKIYLGTTNWAPNILADIADIKGFWKAEGIDVEVTAFEQDSEMANAMKAGKLHMALGMLGSAITWNGEGITTCVVAESDWSHGGDKFILKKGAKMEDLKGALVGAYAEDAAVIYFINKVLSKNNLSLSDIELAELEPEPMTQQLIAGKLVAISSYDPAAANAVSAGGVLIATTADFPGCMPEGLIGNRSLIEKLPEGVMVKFLRGWIKASAWSHDPANWSEFCVIMKTKTYALAAEKPADEAAVKELMEGIRLHDPKTLAERNNEPVTAWLTDIHEFLKKNNRLKTEYDPKEFFNPSYMKEASRP